MIDVILKTNGLDVRVLCTPGEDVEVNTVGKTLDLITKLIDELWLYHTVNISIKTREEQGYSNPPVPHVPDELFKVHEDNMMRVYNEQRTTS
jgi:hypothetical protein